MSTVESKSATPAYGSFKTMMSFVDEIKEGGHVPMQIDRSLMRKQSGSVINEIMGALKFFKFIDEKNRPSKIFEELVLADAESRQAIWARVVPEAYSFVLQADGMNIERATTSQVTDLFRPLGVNGSTLSRAISFFLTVAKEAGIKVSANITPPKLARSAQAQKPKRESTLTPELQPRGESPLQPPPPGVETLEIPIPINRRVRLILPPDFKAADWDLFKAMLEVYVDAWKREKEGNEDKGPTPVKE